MTTPKSYRKNGGRYVILVTEIARITKLERPVVQQVIDALPNALLCLFDQAKSRINLPGLGRFIYRYRKSVQRHPHETKRESHFIVHLRPDPGFTHHLVEILGRPVKFRESYNEALARRQEILRQRALELGLDMKFDF